MHSHAELIERFYGAFRQRDAAAMAACYHPEIHFTDEIFDLHGPQAGAMWAMLIARGKDMTLVFDDIAADDSTGRAHWVATYPFSQTGRTVVNDIRASFLFRDGLIVRHIDRFDFWRWSRMALGTPGLLLGWTPLIRAKVRRTAMAGLDAWMKKKAA